MKTYYVEVRVRELTTGEDLFDHREVYARLRKFDFKADALAAYSLIANALQEAPATKREIPA